MSRPHSCYCAYLAPGSVETCCEEGHKTAAEAMQHAAAVMRGRTDAPRHEAAVKHEFEQVAKAIR